MGLTFRVVEELVDGEGASEIIGSFGVVVESPLEFSHDEEGVSDVFLVAGIGSQFDAFFDISGGGIQVSTVHMGRAQGIDYLNV